MSDILPSENSIVADYYDTQPEYEWQRLERHRTEYAVTLRALEEHLPPAPARVLDCGGGPGRYAIELTRRGYVVTLFDLSQGNLKFAREQADQAGVTLAGYEQGTATDLSRFVADSYDAVLLMGPLYHLFRRGERQQALAEARRVVKPGGMIFAAFIGRYAPFRWAAAEAPHWILEKEAEVSQILATGTHPPQSTERPGFLAYYTHPGEVTPLFHETHLDIVAVLAAEGLISRNGETTINQLQGPLWEAWVDLNYRVAGDISLHGAAEHMLAIAVKPRWRFALASIVRCLDEAGIRYKVAGGTSIALHGVPVPVKDIDLETSAQDAVRFGQLFSADVVQPVALSESELYRSYFGKFQIEGVPVEVMGDLQRREGVTWVPTHTRTETIIDLDGQPVRASWLEEETLAYIRRGRMERATLCLPYCDPGKLSNLVKGEVEYGVL